MAKVPNIVVGVDVEGTITLEQKMSHIYAQMMDAMDPDREIPRPHDGNGPQVRSTRFFEPGCDCPYCQGPHNEVCKPLNGRPQPYHDEIYTKADIADEFFDDTILGPTPNDHQYGYCRVCHAPFRWSVPNQRWEQMTLDELAAEYEAWKQSVVDETAAFLAELREGG